MPTVRLQASVQSGKAVLRFRNGLDAPITITPLVAGMEENEKEWSPLLSGSIKLRPGGIHSADVSDSVLRLFPPLLSGELQQKRFRIRMLLAPEGHGQPNIADCTISFKNRQCMEFICHTEN
ncbi:MAG: hypothetical protein ACYDA9_09950 [Terriglobia bacterium]